jgi:hypothetical protein
LRAFQTPSKTLKNLFPESFDRQKTLIDRLITTKPGPKTGSKQKSKAFKGRRERFSEPESFFAELNRLINLSDEEKPTRKSIAVRFSISADTLDDLRQKFGDRRGWRQIIKDARKESANRQK